MSTSGPWRTSSWWLVHGMTWTYAFQTMSAPPLPMLYTSFPSPLLIQFYWEIIGIEDSKFKVCSIMIWLVPWNDTWNDTMATHSSTLAWKTPWMEEPGRLRSMGLLGVEHDWATSLSLFTFMDWRRKWQPTPVFLPGKPQGQRSLVSCSLWGRTESDTTEAT